MKRWNLHRPFKGARGAPGTGEPGPEGKSAYQIAVDNGFSGAPSEWIASLVGPSGSNGADGQRGSLWYGGTGAPSMPALPGDMYLDTDTGDVWAYI